MPNAAASRLVLEPYSETLVISAAHDCLKELGCNPSVAIVAASSDYREHLQDFVELIQLHAHASLVVGGSATGLVGTGIEAEDVSGFSILLLSLPQTRLSVVTFDETQSDNYTAEDWRAFAGARADADAWIFFGNPVTTAAELWLQQWTAAFPKAPVLGGVVSGGENGNDIFLFHNRTLVEGGILLGIKGGVKLHSVVSQGCRPVGEPHAITGAEENMLLSIGSLPAYERFSEVLHSLPPHEQRHAQHNLFCGFAFNEYMDDFKTGDFLIRNILHTDPKSEAIDVAAYPRVGQTFQFQLRDREVAREELEHQLSTLRREGVRPFASIAFLCRGRGERLFGKSHHDAQMIQKTFGSLPSIGMFCNGEVGPVGNASYLHGLTTTLAFFA